MSKDNYRILIHNWLEHNLICGSNNLNKRMIVKWTRNTKHLIPARVRNTLIGILNGTPCPNHLIGQLQRYKFDSKGCCYAKSS